MDFVENDSGRQKAGFIGDTGDCVCRAIAIATELDYKYVYNALIETKSNMKKTKKVTSSHPRTGVSRLIYDKFLKSLGWTWIPCVKIGSGCSTHLKASELPKGRIICRVSKHMVAVIDGVLHDTYDCSRSETRCVYGYYIKK